MEREEGHRETTVAERWVQVCCSYSSVGQNPGPVQPRGSVNESFSPYFELHTHDIHWSKDRPSPVTH